MSTGAGGILGYPELHAQLGGTLFVARRQNDKDGIEWLDRQSRF